MGRFTAQLEFTFYNFEEIDMTSKEVSCSGYILSDSKEHHTAYDLHDGKITIHAYQEIPEIEARQQILAQGFDQKLYLFHSPVAFQLQNSGVGFFNANFTQPVDWTIKDYEYGTRYSEARFCFAELQYFCPPVASFSPSADEVVFYLKPQEVCSFQIELLHKPCMVTFLVRSSGNIGVGYSRMKAQSEIVVSFAETEDFNFLCNVYDMVDGVFAFLCNRRNTTCTSMTLSGMFPRKMNRDGTVTDTTKACSSKMFFFDRYREDPEDDQKIQKTAFARDLLPHIGQLFHLVAKDLSRENGDDPTGVSLLSIHPSFFRRNLIDLQQSLHVTAAFEFYVRSYLPPMVVEGPHHAAVRKLLEDFAETHTGKEKELARSMAKHVVKDPALSDKIVKAWKGYDGWAPLAPCLPKCWSQLKDIQTLACEANKWRNDLAHEKRMHSPDQRTISAVRLIEHLNYAIVLRKIGCTDDEIRHILQNLLKQN